MAGIVLITGAARGIGRGLAKKFAAEGWLVLAAARRTTDVPLDPAIHAIPLDVLSDDSVSSAAATIAAGYPCIDMLINNAAVFPGEGNERLEDIPAEWFEDAFATNVVGVIRVTRAFLPLLRKSASARIINISSGAGTVSEKTDSAYYPYSVSKAALNMLTRAMAAEYREEKIPVFALSPGWVKTDMGGSAAPLSVEESAGSLFQTTTRLELEKSGGFFGRDGEVYPW